MPTKVSPKENKKQKKKKIIYRMITKMNQDPEYLEFVEVDPTGRYGRYNEILGKGSSKIVYRGFDEYEGIEVAWNQVKLYDFLQSPEDLERLYCEIHLLKTLKHKNIMKFYTSWVDTSNRNINFVTEMFTSGTLRQYRQKHRKVNIRAVKHWCRQILKGLLYLHSRDPPVIHRDLKCDNIFINGNQGEVKIGDLGLAAILRKSHAAHCVGTPEFMAPEVYQEEYNELVDIYSFGMCVLEMVTFEYPYSECTHPAQIYKKVISGTKPDALYRVEDPEVREFVDKCLATASRRLSARELLKDPFLQIEDQGVVSSDGDGREFRFLFGHPSLDLLNTNGFANGYSNDHQIEIENGWDYDAADISTHGIDLFNIHEDELVANVDITIKGKRKDDGGIFLRLRITDKEGKVRNIYFPFDIETDTALSVATEMVGELDITDYEVTRIAEMIDSEVSLLVPEWELGPGLAETPRFHPVGLCGNCASNVSSCGSLLDYLSKTQGYFGNIRSAHCSNLDCGEMHGRFEEITYQGEGSEEQCFTEEAPGLSTSQSDEPDLCSSGSRVSHRDEDFQGKDGVEAHGVEYSKLLNSFGNLDTNFYHDPDSANFSDDYENELRWLKAQYQMELRKYRNRQVGGSRKALHPSLDWEHENRSFTNEISPHWGFDGSPVSRSCPSWDAQRAPNCEANADSSPVIFTAKNFYCTGSLAPNCLARTKSLPIDASDV